MNYSPGRENSNMQSSSSMQGSRGLVVRTKNNKYKMLTMSKKKQSIQTSTKFRTNVCTSVYRYPAAFKTESGSVLPAIEITYTVHGELTNTNKKVIWIVHALTANSDPLEWWDGLVGSQKLFDPNEYTIVCANNLGSCYGTTGPMSINPLTNVAYAEIFPLVTIRDMSRVLELLRRHLGIEKIHLLIGGSMGGQVGLEWAIEQPELFENLVPIATNARHSAWGIAFNEAQRLALGSGVAGLVAARAIALLSYRGYAAYNATQTDEDERIDFFRAASYQQYQGEKLVKRFNSDSYYALSKAMDSHNVGRGRVSIKDALAKIKARTLVVGISSDILFPVQEQQLLAETIQDASLAVIDSEYGHDGFLLEYNKLERLLRKFLKK